MSPSKKSPKLVSPKAKKGKKGAASVFPKDNLSSGRFLSYMSRAASTEIE